MHILLHTTTQNIFAAFCYFHALSLSAQIYQMYTYSDISMIVRNAFTLVSEIMERSHITNNYMKHMPLNVIIMFMKFRYTLFE